MVLVIKNLSVNAGDIRDSGLIPGSGRSPGVGNSNPFQYSHLENTRDRRAWWTTVHGVAKSGTSLSDLAHIVWHSTAPRLADVIQSTQFNPNF